MTAATLAGDLSAHFSLVQNLEFFLRILVASACGACIGLERVRRLKEAGIRTHVIVCCAAALMIIVSKYGFADLTAADGTAFPGSRGADPARVAAQVVSGVSFLGAGVIFKHGNSIQGLTTAAGIWATAGIGLAVGAGMYGLGIASTVTMVLLQYFMHHLPIGVDFQSFHLEFTIQAAPAFRDDFMAYLDKRHIQVVKCDIDNADNGRLAYNMMVKLPHNVSLHDVDAFLRQQGDLPSIHYSTIT